MQLISATYFWGGVMVVLSGQCNCLKSLTAILPTVAKKQSNIADHLHYNRSPGRWSAVQNLQLMIAYITLNYEIQPIAKGPESVVLGDANVTSMSNCIKIGRRRI